MKDEPSAGPEGDAESGDKDKDKGEDKGEPARPRPAPELSPGQVVQIQMEALKSNDESDGGIAVVFDFASPGNKQATGPLERFAKMVKNEVYGPMLNFKTVQYSRAVVEDDQAQQVVKVVDAAGGVAVYVFRLSKQGEGEFEGCWMTDAVIRIDKGAGEEREPGTPVGHPTPGGNGRYRA